MSRRKFKDLGVMIDCSRNAVMSPEGLKRFMPLLKKMGYNCVMLYTEDTYEVEGEPYFGYMRGRYSIEEMRDIDDFAASLGIEVIPCIQTLAHMNAFLRWKKVPVDTGDILLTDDERTYELIDRMLSTLSGCFRSRRIHIGMDEAEMLGRGKHLDLHGYEEVSTIMKRHLGRVLEITARYGYEPMIWSDMFFKPWNGGKYNAKRTTVPKEYVEAFPKGLIPVYWNYCSTREEVYSDMLSNHMQLSKKTWFAGGIWSWRGFTPHNSFSIQNMTSALDACVKTGIKSVFMTLWGDHGGECSHFAQLPALHYIAEYARGERDESKIKARFKRLTGMEYDDFARIEAANEITGNEQAGAKSPSKNMLYSDPFNGFLDYTVMKGGGEKLQRSAEELRAIAKKSRKWGYIFRTQAALCELLAVKYELGVKTRAAYQSGDTDELARLAREDYAAAIRLADSFARTFEQQWFCENKTSGFDVQDLRLGGLIRRLDACRRRLSDYVSGRISRIEELECEILPFMDQYPRGVSCDYNGCFANNSTANIL